MADPFTRWAAVAAPLPWPDINTDDIAPGPEASPVLRRRGGGEIASDPVRMGENAFAGYRFNADGSPKADFVLNRKPYDRAGILVTGPNFGCGSSRETAVWALIGIGIRCVIAPSFGEIFYNNCSKNGLVPARVDAAAGDALAKLAESSSDPTFTVDLETCTIESGVGARWAFSIGAYQRQLLLDGRDEITMTLQRLSQIEAYESDYFDRRPWLVPSP